MFFWKICALKLIFFGFFVNFTYSFKFTVIILSQNGSVPSRHDLCPFLSPGFRNPDFCPVVRFFKNYIFGSCMSWGVSQFKKKFRANFVGDPVLPKIGYFQILWGISVNYVKLQKSFEIFFVKYAKINLTKHVIYSFNKKLIIFWELKKYMWNFRNHTCYLN